jgi:hypothetical protein
LLTHGPPLGFFSGRGTARKWAFRVLCKLFKPTVNDHPRVMRIQEYIFKITLCYVKIPYMEYFLKNRHGVLPKDKIIYCNTPILYFNYALYIDFKNNCSAIVNGAAPEDGDV